MRAAQLVGDEVVRRLGIGNAQQRFGEAHQRQPFARAERKLLEEAFDHALLQRRSARRAHHRRRIAFDPAALLDRKRLAREQSAHRISLVAIFEVVDTVPVDGGHRTAPKLSGDTNVMWALQR